MNFLGHAAVACWTASDPGFVLGAMLPDFAHMIGERLDRLEDDGLRCGERHHRKTDEAFHRAASFRTLVRDATSVLTRGGLERGPARGAAHVGIELLFDGAPVGDVRADAPYLDPLDPAPAPEPDEPIVMGFRHWLEVHRGAARSTVKQYCRGASELLEALADDTQQWGPQQVRTFFLERCARDGSVT